MIIPTSWSTALFSRCWKGLEPLPEEEETSQLRKWIPHKPQQIWTCRKSPKTLPNHLKTVTFLFGKLMLAINSFKSAFLRGLCRIIERMKEKKKWEEEENRLLFNLPLHKTISFFYFPNPLIFIPSGAKSTEGINTRAADQDLKQNWNHLSHM